MNTGEICKSVWRLLLWACVVSILSGCVNPNKQKVPRANKGVLDLTQWDFASDGPVKLSGDWKFYWNDFILDSLNPSKVDSGFMEVPGLWNKHKIGETILPKHGYASYKLTILLPDERELAIKYLNSASSCEVFVNGQSEFVAGKPGKSEIETVPSYKPGIFSFKPGQKQIDIVLQLANFHHRKGGQWEPIVLGLRDQIDKIYSRTLFLELFFSGSIFVMALFHLALFFLHNEDKSSLYFGAFSLLIFMKFLVSGEFSIYLLGNFSWRLLVMVDYLSFYLAILFFTLFLKSLYNNEVNSKMVSLIKIVSLIYAASVIIFKPNVFSYFVLSFQILSIAGGLYAFYVLIKAIQHRRNGAIPFLTGFIVLFVCMVHDILKENDFVNTVSFVPFGLTFFILLKSFILSSRIRFALEANKKLSAELALQNKEYALLTNQFKIQNEVLQKAKEKAEESDRFKSAFLANISHEIRTPMNGILGFADLLSGNDISSEKRKKYISILKERSKYLLGVVNDIIDISRIETGQVNIQLSVFSINELFTNLFDAYFHAAGQKGIMLIQRLELTDEHSYITSDKVKLKQIIENLLSNALKFTAQGTIEFGYQIKDQKLHIYVKDTGIGIEKSEQRIIFDRFNQANLTIAKKYGGTGLGLSIVKAYVKLLGGEIIVESTAGNGSRFAFSVPYIQSNFVSRSIFKKSDQQNKKSNLKILLVEDNMTNAYLIHEILNQHNVELIHAANGEEAVRFYKQHTDLQLVLMDIKLPDTDGYNLTRKLLALRGHVPVIAQTAFALKGDREKAIEAGCVDYMSKPIDSKELITKINHYAVH